MKLKSIRIERPYSYSDKILPLEGVVEFQSANGKNEIKLKLDERLSSEVVALCATAIARAGREAADNLCKEVLYIEHEAPRPSLPTDLVS